MDLNKIELPNSVLAALYKNSLINEDNKTTASKPNGSPATKMEKQQPANAIQFLGKNQQHICVLVNYEQEVYLPDAQLQFLTAILQACKLNLGDVAIVNYHQHQPTIAQLITVLKCRSLLIFGIDPAQLGANNIPLYSAEKINNCTIVCAAAAEALNNSTNESKILKSKLWVCLKQLFNI
jgi:hypothetical protein